MDDAALSCAALIARDEPIDVITVCCGRPKPPIQGDWDRACGFADSEEAISARLAEERAAFAGTRHRLTTLDVLESQHLPGPRDASDDAPVAEAVRAWLARSPGGTVALPACAGRSSQALEGVFGAPTGARRDRIKRIAGPLGRRVLAAAHRAVVHADDVPVVHGDHRYVRDAALEGIRLAGGAPVLLYEEVPYLWGDPADREVARVAARTGLAPSAPVSVAVDREAKAARLAAYGSQLPQLQTQGAPLDSPAGLPREERYWWLGPAPAAGA